MSKLFMDWAKKFVNYYVEKSVDMPLSNYSFCVSNFPISRYVETISLSKKLHPRLHPWCVRPQRPLLFLTCFYACAV